MSIIQIIIAEDDTWYTDILKYHLELNPGWAVSTVETGKDLLLQMKNKPDVITLDYNLPDFTGAVLLKRLKKEYPDTHVIMISGQEDIKTALSLLKDGAYDYLVKDHDTKDRLWKSIENIQEKLSLRKEVEMLREEVEKKYNFSKTIIGNSNEIKGVFGLLEKATKSGINVSITGETGTGKEVVAKAIHYNSDRRKYPFIAINVSAIPADLIESELFGHEKGAFTGADSRRLGKFEEAKNGTIFLDEIGEMDMNMQTKLLRVLQERELVRVGGNELVKIDCRIICATHRNLKEEVKKGTFRQDLFYRIIGLPIELPPLRDRKQDVILLAKYFMDKFSTENNYKKKKLSESAQNKLLSYTFPGNVRELKAVVDLSIVLSDGNEINGTDIEFHGSDPMNDMSFSEMTMREYEHKILRHFLDKHNNNILKVADILDIGKSTIYRMLKRN